MGVLGDIYSAIDTQKRRLAGLLDDPVGTLRQKIAQFGEDQSGLLNLQANAYPMAGDKTVLNSPDQIAQFRQQLAQEAGNQAMAGVFMGPSSKTWDAIRAKQAEQMRAAGKSPQEVWQATGTSYMHPDTIPRQEISDHLSKFNTQADLSKKSEDLMRKANEMRAQVDDSLLAGKNQNDLWAGDLHNVNRDMLERAALNDRIAQGPMGMVDKLFGTKAPYVLEHPELYKAEPSLADVPIKQGGDGGVDTLGNHAGSPKRID